jgi:hypothetical protein
MKRGWLMIGVTFSMCACFAVAQGGSTAPATTQQSVAKNNRVDAAKHVVDILIAREAAGEALTPSLLQLKSDWQRRLFEARLAAASTKEDKLSVVRERISEARKALDAQPNIHGKAPLMKAIEEFDLADAEARLAEIGE